MFDLTENQQYLISSSYSDGEIYVGKLAGTSSVNMMYTIPCLVEGFKPYYVKLANNRALIGSDCGSIFLLDFTVKIL